MFLFIFYLSIFWLFYAYVGYPLCVYLLSACCRKNIAKLTIEPEISILIAAYNEEDSIAETLQNKLELDYPVEKIEIIVISDESIDATDGIVNSFKKNNVRLLRQEPRAGKTSALNLAISHARGEIIVFSDANSLYEKDALMKLVANFADPQVGYVTGKMVYVNHDGSYAGDGCSSYMKYENFLRRCESAIGSVVGADGGIDAMRKELYLPMDPDQLPDFVQPLKVVEQGYRVVYEPDAVLKESSLKDENDEYKMRVRVSLRAMWALYDMRQLLLFRKDPLFTWQLWSHKVLRYLCFVPLFSCFLSNIFLLGYGSFFVLFFLLQFVIYTTAFISPRLRNDFLNSRVITFIRYFMLLNVACAHAFLKFLVRQKQVLWTPRKG